MADKSTRPPLTQKRLANSKISYFFLLKLKEKASLYRRGVPSITSLLTSHGESLHMGDVSEYYKQQNKIVIPV